MPSGPAALLAATAATDDATCEAEVLGALAAGLTALSGASGTAVVSHVERHWQVEAVSGAVSLQPGDAVDSPACDRVADVPVVVAQGDPVAAAGPVTLLPVRSLDLTVAVAVVPTGEPLDDDTAALVEVLLRHAGLHVVRVRDAEVRDDLLGQRATAMSALARMADTDSLTGVANRAGLFRVLSSLTGRAQPVGVVLVDLDRFKQVNDAHGHRTGDELLRQAAARLSALVRPTDMVARLGGDEFVVVARDTDTAALVGLVGRIEQAFATPFSVDGLALPVAASAGYAMSTGGRSAVDLLHAADRGMYERKRAGRTHEPGDAHVIDLHPSSAQP